MSEKKTKAKLSTSRLITLCMAVAFLLAGAIYLAFQVVPISVIIRGDKLMYVEVFSDYTEYGAVDRFTNEELTPVGQVDTSKVGTYFISYSTQLQTLKRIVKVVDTQAPVISFDDPYDIYCTVNTELPEQGYTVTDNYDAELHNQTVMDSQVDITAIGDYEFTVEASDSSGNKAVAVKNVHVVEDDFHYLSKITNVDNIDEAMLQPVIDWMNLYYQSMKYLVPQDPSKLFASDCQDRGYLSYKAFENIDAVRRSQKNDLYMDSCSYSLHLVSKTDSGNGITRLFFTEDCELQFRFLKGKTSQQGMIWNYFYLKEENGVYKLTDVYHEESFYLYLYQRYNGSQIQQIDQLSADYLKLMEEATARREAQKEAVNNGEAVYTPSPAANPYNREAAQAYAMQYGTSRNDYYRSHGSNCMNFVSQCLHAGGIPYDNVGEWQWKYLSKIHDAYSATEGYTYSWIGIGYFHDYLDYKGSKGMVLQQDINPYLGEPGDILYCDYSDRALSRSPHVILVGDIVYDEEGKIIDILVCGNTNDQVNYPLSAVGYPYTKLSKVCGYN